MGKYKEDEKRLSRLQKGDQQEWKRFYEDLRDPFRLFFLKSGALDADEATALFQHAVVIFHQNVISGKLTPPLKSTLKTYLFGVGKLLFIKNGGKGEGWEEEIPDEAVLPDIEIQSDQQEKAALVRNLLNRIGDPCRQLLEMIYIKGYAVEAVASAMGFPSEGAVRKRKFDCLKKMRSLLNSN